MLFLLYNSPEFQHVDLKKREEAAWQARQCAMHHWQFWLAILVLVASVMVGSLLQEWLLGDGDTVGGGFVGFILGMCWYGRTLYVIGMPHCRRIVSKPD